MRKIDIEKVLFIGFSIFIIGLFEMVDFIPVNLQSVDLVLFKIESAQYSSLVIAYWVISMKLALILVCVYWYSVTFYWWRFVIWVPVIIELYKLIEALNFSERYLDVNDYLKSLPFTIPLVVIAAYVFWKEIYYIQSVKLLKEVDGEIDTVVNDLVNNAHLKLMETKLVDLRLKKTKLTQKEYYSELNILKESIKEI